MDESLYCRRTYVNPRGIERFTAGKLYKISRRGISWITVSDNYGISANMHDSLDGILGKHFIRIGCDTCKERKCNSCPKNKETN
jgi:hypothetical protein